MFAINQTQDEYESQSNGLDAYFTEWYEDQCKRSARHTSVATHRQLLEVLSLLRNPQQDQTFLAQNLTRARGSILSHTKRIETSVILAARLMSMTSIGEIEFCISLGRSVKWQQ